MPTYEYECRSCDHKFEVFQYITDKPRRKCPECGKGVRRLIGTGSAILFRGSGFYETDYKRSGKDKESKSESSGDKKKPEASKNSETSET